MMSKHKKHHKECKISEIDVASVLERYPATAILGLLREVAQHVGSGAEKIDWDTLATKTTTGISNPREYQMLWRHLAYRHSFLDILPNETQTLDDDSDLECEVEAFPDINAEVSSEAAAFVKVLMSSGLENDSGCINGSMVEAPLTINIPCNYISGSSSEGVHPQGLNISIPVFLQKQPLSGAAATVVDPLEVNGSADARHKKKRKHWTKDEDRELTEAVKQFGVGNWATIVRGDYKWDRTATQLSQRWAHLRRKKPGVYSMGRDCSSNLSEAQQAARHAMNLALDPPTKTSILSSAGGTVLNSLNNPVSTSLASSAEASSSQHQFQQHPSSAISKTSLKTDMSSNSGIKSMTSNAGIKSLSSTPGIKPMSSTGVCNTQPDAVLLIKSGETLLPRQQSTQLASASKPPHLSTPSSVAKPHLASEKSDSPVNADASSTIVTATASAVGTRTGTNSSAEPSASRSDPLTTHCQPSQVQAKPFTSATLGSISKPHINLERNKVVTGKSDLSADPVRAAAVAAGARIATPSDAASLFKAAQAKNAVHIIATGSIKPSTPSCPPPQPAQISSSAPTASSAMATVKASMVTSLPAVEETKTLEATRNQIADVLDMTTPAGRALNTGNGMKQLVGNSGSSTNGIKPGIKVVPTSASNISAKSDKLEGDGLLKTNVNGPETCNSSAQVKDTDQSPAATGTSNKPLSRSQNGHVNGTHP